MWIFLNDAFFSIVEPGTDLPPKDRKGNLVVRARMRGDIEKVFRGSKVKETPARDYRFRAIVPRARVAEVIAWRIKNIDYGNFKNSVKNDKRHKAYGRVWGVMLSLQEPSSLSMTRSLDF